MADSPPNKGDGPKRHHTVPRFYLERFAVNEHVELVDRNDFTKSTRPLPVVKVLAESYFYSIEVEEGGRDPIAENMLAVHVEGPAAQAIRRMFDKEACPLTAPGRRSAISLFLAFQFLRGPGTRHALVEQHKAISAKTALMATPEMVLKSARERGREMTEEEAIETVEFAHSGEYTIDVERQANLHLGVAFPAVFETIKFFQRRWWRVLTFDEPCLLTSDEPVALVMDPHKPGGGGGLPAAREIVFPIDSRRALVMVRPDLETEDSRQRGTPEQARIINEHVAFNAHRYIVRTPGTDPLAGMKLPEKAPAVFVVGDVVAMAPNVSLETRTKFLKHARFKRAPEEPEEPGV